MFFPVALQSVVVLLTVAALGYWKGVAAAGAALYGGVAALANSALLGWRQRQAERRIHSDAGRHLRSFYRSSLERIVVVSVWLGLGLGGLGLEPMPMLVGFIIGLLAWVIAAAGRFLAWK